MVPSAAVTIALFLVTAIYQAGRISQRIEDLERWRAELKPQLDSMFSTLRNIEAVITGKHL